jgi:hypothetical protein
MPSRPRLLDPTHGAATLAVFLSPASASTQSKTKVNPAFGQEIGINTSIREGVRRAFNN